MKQFLVTLGDDGLIQDMEELPDEEKDVCEGCEELRDATLSGFRELREEIAVLKQSIQDHKKVIKELQSANYRPVYIPFPEPYPAPLPPTIYEYTVTCSKI